MYSSEMSLFEKHFLWDEHRFSSLGESIKATIMKKISPNVNKKTLLFAKANENSTQSVNQQVIKKTK